MTLNDLEPSERKRLARSAGGGAVFWVLALILLAFAPVTRKPFPEPDYPPVHLSLTSPVTAEAPVRQTAAQTEPAPQSQTPATTAPKAQSAPAKTPTPAKPAPATKPAATGKTQPTKSAPSAASSGLGIPDFDKPVTSSNTSSGDSEFLDFTSSRQTQNPASASVPSGGTLQSELQGSAATVTAAKGTGASVSSKTASGSSGTASASTVEALKGVEGAASSALSPSAATGSSGSASAYADTSTTSAGRVSSVAGLSFDGQPRTLIYPDDPRITLPDRLARLVDSNRTATVKFTVRKDGSVPGTLVTFTPLSSLPAEIRDYLRAEFARWRFEAGDQDGQASFSYSIKLE